MLLAFECLPRLCVVEVNVIRWAILELRKSFVNQVNWVMSKSVSAEPLNFSFDG
jgi:hypothetical protein